MLTWFSAKTGSELKEQRELRPKPDTKKMNILKLNIIDRFKTLMDYEI
jgi:hypothetical protein